MAAPKFEFLTFARGSFFRALPSSSFFAFFPGRSAHSALGSAPLRRTIQRKGDPQWRGQKTATVCFVGRSSEPMRGTRNTRNTVPNPVVAKRARRPVGAPGWPKRRTRTTFAAPRMSRGCSHGERLTRGTGGERAAKGGHRRRCRLRYKISARRRPLKSRKILKSRRTMRYKISGAINRLF